MIVSNVLPERWVAERWAPALGIVILAACAGAAPRPTGGGRAIVNAALEPGVVYEMAHREERTLDGETRSTRTRLLVELVETLPDGSSRLRVRMLREASDSPDAELVDALAEVTLDASGHVRGEPSTSCGSHGELRLGRYLRHVLGLRALRLGEAREGSVASGFYASDTSEAQFRARFRVDRLGDERIELRMSSRYFLDAGDVGELRVRGNARALGRITLSRADPFAGRTEVRTRIEGRVTELATGRERQATLLLRTTLAVRRARDASEVPARCGFDSGVVVQAIRTRLRAIQACYEAQLAHTPTLTGRILIAFRIPPSGRLEHAEAREDSVGSPALVECMIRVLSELRFRPGPIGGPVGYAYPFVFAPQSRSVSSEGAPDPPARPGPQAP